MPLMLPWQVAPGANIWRKNTQPFFVTRKAAAEYCTNSLAATECGTSWSSIQWTTLLLFFVGVICSFKAERRVMFLPCKGESFCTYNTLHVCARELWDFTLQTRSPGAASDLHRAT